MIPRTKTEVIVVHGSWTPPSFNGGVEEIRKWHLERDPPFDDIGYHFVIRRDGTIEEGRDVELMGAHVRGYNANSIGICMMGGKDVNPEWGNYVTEQEFVEQELVWEFNYTFRQIVALTGLVGRLMEEWPDITDVCGHRDFPGVTKRCPGFDVREFFGPAARHIR